MSGTLDDATVRIKVHAPSVVSSGPVLLTFLSGPPPESLLQGAGVHAVSFDFSKRSKGLRRRLKGHSDIAVYEGTNFGQTADAAGAYKCVDRVPSSSAALVRLALASHLTFPRSLRRASPKVRRVRSQ